MIKFFKLQLSYKVILSLYFKGCELLSIKIYILEFDIHCQNIIWSMTLKHYKKINEIEKKDELKRIQNFIHLKKMSNAVAMFYQATLAEEISTKNFEVK